MLFNNRVVQKDNLVLTDLSSVLSDLNGSGAAFSIVAAEDALYIGSDHPFNHRFFSVKPGAANSVAGSVTVDIWSGTAWNPAVDVQDFTKDGGAPFAKSGLILFAPDRLKGWGVADSTERVTGLTTLKIYNCYWARLNFSAAFVMTLDYLGHKFSKDSDFNLYYGDLNRPKVREAFFENPTPSWDKVHCAAAEEVIRDLRARKIIWSPNQILDPDQFTDCATHKAAEIIYSPGNLGEEEKAASAAKRYREACDKMVFNVDTDRDGRLDQCEKVSIGTLRRC